MYLAATKSTPFMVIVIFNQRVHSVKLIYSAAPDKTYNIDTYNKQIYKSKHAYKTYNKRSKDKITIKNLNNNFELTTKWQLQ